MVGVIGVLALVTVVPGPDMAVVTQHAIAHGCREAARVAAGVVTGLLVWGVFCVVGLAAVLAAAAQAYAVVKLMGLLVLVHAVLSLAWLACVAHAVSAARSFFERPRVRVVLERVTGVVLIGFGLRVAAEAN
ncbi:hypothetical protein CTU88_38825 [Streptomyces sp. JV178]|nr:hypothetical protein CTU88_38825 [Streptomyces sp. JV178]